MSTLSDPAAVGEVSPAPVAALSKKISPTTGFNTHKVYVGNLPESATLEDLEDCFGQIGACVCSLKRGFGFVDYNERSCAEEAVAKYHEGHFLGALIKVELSHARSGAVAAPVNENGQVTVRNPPGSDRPSDSRKPMHINGPPGANSSMRRGPPPNLNYQNRPYAPMSHYDDYRGAPPPRDGWYDHSRPHEPYSRPPPSGDYPPPGQGYRNDYYQRSPLPYAPPPHLRGGGYDPYYSQAPPSHYGPPPRHDPAPYYPPPPAARGSGGGGGYERDFYRGGESYGPPMGANGGGYDPRSGAPSVRDGRDGAAGGREGRYNPYSRDASPPARRRSLSPVPRRGIDPFPAAASRGVGTAGDDGGDAGKSDEYVPSRR